MALDAHVPLQDIEFVQFHPTGIHGFGILISEAARAEGGVLRNRLGEQFMKRYAPSLMDLAPRDIISRAILEEISAGRGIDGKDYVYLDLRALGREHLNQKLPEITSFVKTYLGIDPSIEPIPVAPTCHYMMGGIPTDTDGHVLFDCEGNVLPNLYAVGECACVSVHGANRLGCNSLIDLVVFGKRTGQAIINDVQGKEKKPLPLQVESVVECKISNLLDSGGSENVFGLRERMQHLMTMNCSVFREGAALENALAEIRFLRKRYLNLGLVNKGMIFNYELEEAIELGNMLRVAECIVYSALERKESRGAHYRIDYLERKDTEWLNHTLVAETHAGLSVMYKPVSITRFRPQPRRY